MNHSVRQSGFTLIEMIIVIVLIGILAIIVAPKLFDYSHDAEKARIKQTFAAFSSGIMLANTQWQANGGGTQGMNNMQGYAGDSLDMNDVGYPLGTEKGEPMTQPHNIGKGHQGCYELFTALVDTEYTFSKRNADFDKVDFISKRKVYKFNDAQGSPTSKLALCYYIYTRQGYNSDPSKAETVYWYNSRTGEVTITEPK